MYNLHLETSHFPAQTDTEIRDISVGGLLREIASSHPDSIAMVDVAAVSYTHLTLPTNREV